MDSPEKRRTHSRLRELGREAWRESLDSDLTCVGQRIREAVRGLRDITWLLVGCAAVQFVEIPVWTWRGQETLGESHSDSVLGTINVYPPAIPYQRRVFPWVSVSVYGSGENDDNFLGRAESPTESGHKLKPSAALEESKCKSWFRCLRNGLGHFPCFFLLSIRHCP